MAHTLKVRLAATLMIGTLIGLFVLTAALYTRAFADTQRITITTERSGLIMDPGNKVKYRGVEIGRVVGVDKTSDGASLDLDIDSDELGRIAGDVGAEIRASTIFGPKFIELMDPPGFEPVTAATSLRADSVIDATSTTREVNTLFESLDNVLSNVDVLGLNNTLSVLATTLGGRGDKIAALAAQADAYLTQLEPQLPQLRRDLRQLARLSELGVQVAPAVLDILDNSVKTSITIATKGQQLDRLLVDLNLLGRTGTDVISANIPALSTALARVRPTSKLLSDYSSEISCFLIAVDNNHQLLDNVTGGGDSPGIDVIATLRPAIKPFAVGTDLPTAYAGKGPKCGFLPGPVTVDDIPAEGLTP